MKEYVVTFVDGNPVTIKAEYVEATAVAFMFTGSGVVAVVPNNAGVRHIIAKEPVVETPEVPEGGETE